jgi:Uma2 family endonuclease
MRGAAPRPWTVEEFLAWERAQEERYEYIDGVIRMMTGGTLDHALIKGNLHAALHRALRRSPCMVFVDGPKVAAADTVMYPDVAVTCAPELRHKEDVLRDPVLVAEVLSKSTEGQDRGGKWRAYREIPSLNRYLLIAQGEMMVEVFTRRPDGWAYTVCAGRDATLELPEFGLDLPLAELYERTSLDPSRAAP